VTVPVPLNLSDPRFATPSRIVEHQTHFAVIDPRGVLKANIHWGLDGAILTRPRALEIALRLAGTPMLLTRDDSQPGK
jgi:hypothetical protein